MPLLSTTTEALQSQYPHLPTNLNSQLSVIFSSPPALYSFFEKLLSAAHPSTALSTALSSALPATIESRDLSPAETCRQTLYLNRHIDLMQRLASTIDLLELSFDDESDIINTFTQLTVHHSIPKSAVVNQQLLLSDYLDAKLFYSVHVHGNQLNLPSFEEPFNVVLKFFTVTCSSYTNAVATLLHTLKHEGTVSFYGVHWPASIGSQQQSFAIFERMTCNLEKWRQSKYDQNNCFSVIHQIAQALVYLHLQRIRHGAVNPRNVLVNMTEENKLTAKLDLSHFLCREGHGISAKRAICYSSPYSAPEEFQFSDQGHLSVDVWSFGVLTSYLFCKNIKQFDSVSRFSVLFAKGEAAKVSTKLVHITDESVQEIVASCLVVNRANRPTMVHILAIINNIIKRTKEDGSPSSDGESQGEENNDVLDTVMDVEEPGSKNGPGQSNDHQDVDENYASYMHSTQGSSLHQEYAKGEEWGQISPATTNSTQQEEPHSNRQDYARQRLNERKKQMSEAPSPVREDKAMSPADTSKDNDGSLSLPNTSEVLNTRAALTSSLRKTGSSRKQYLPFDPYEVAVSMPDTDDETVTPQPTHASKQMERSNPSNNQSSPFDTPFRNDSANGSQLAHPLQQDHAPPQPSKNLHVKPPPASNKRLGTGLRSKPIAKNSAPNKKRSDDTLRVKVPKKPVMSFFPVSADKQGVRVPKVPTNKIVNQLMKQPISAPSTPVTTAPSLKSSKPGAALPQSNGDTRRVWLPAPRREVGSGRTILSSEESGEKDRGGGAGRLKNKVHLPGVNGPLSQPRTEASKRCDTTQSDMQSLNEQGEKLAAKLKKSSGDWQEAFKYFKRAAHKGCAKGHYNLARCYETGNGTNRGGPDMELAKTHFDASGRSGCVAASEWMVKYYKKHGVGETDKDQLRQWEKKVIEQRRRL